MIGIRFTLEHVSKQNIMQNDTVRRDFKVFYTFTVEFSGSLTV